MVKIRRWIQLLFCLSLVFSTSVWAETTARFNRDTIRLNETVELIIESDQTSISRGVDFSEIEKQFRIVSQRRDTSASIINGQSQLVHRWRTELAPLSVGSFGVGPIIVDSEQTNRLRLTVLPQAEEASISEEVFIEVEIDNNDVYVQQQILLTAKLFISVCLLEGALADPAPGDTLVRRLGKDVRYETKRGGQSYAVFQRRYAMIPQKSGELVIPAMQFEGLADDIGTSGYGVFSPLYSQGRRIYANGKALRVTVKPPPAAFSGKSWLPAETVTISEEGGSINEIEVGQPITRKIRLQGVNVAAEQLPEPVVAELSDIRSYPDQSRLETIETETGLVGTLSIDVAMIGSKPGEFILPEIAIPWWNTVTDQPERAVLPERRINVINGAAQSANAEINPTATENAVSQPEPVGEDIAQPRSLSSRSERRWQRIAIAMLLLWLVTLAAFAVIWRSGAAARTGKNNETTQLKNPDMAQHYTRLAQACRSDDALAARNALVDWARARFGTAMSLPQIADHLPFQGEATEALRVQLMVLDKNLFADASRVNWKGSALWHLFERVSAEPSNKKLQSESEFPALYPTTLNAHE